jgi:hypothetical protein
MLHKPREPAFLAVLPTLPQTDEAAALGYHRYHSARTGRVLSDGRPWIATFAKVADLGGGASGVLFMGLYRNRGVRPIGLVDFRADDAVRRPIADFGVYAENFASGAAPVDIVRVEMDPAPALSALTGRLSVAVRLSQGYIRKAENLAAPVHAIAATPAGAVSAPDWREMIADAAILRAIPPGWAARLAQWRGVYLIVDRDDGARYVGSACGADNLLGRWQAHVAGEHGMTVGLAKRDPARFRFSILERMSPDAPPDEVIARERSWMERLDTVRFGLNRAAEASRREATHGA